MVVAVFVLMLASYVVASLRRPSIPSGSITPPNPVAIGDTLVGPLTVTVDATAQDRWTYFAFNRNSALAVASPDGWDLAFRRFYIIANGGPRFGGHGGILDLGRVSFDSVTSVPDTGYVQTEADSINPAIRRWYDYGFTSHLLPTKNHVYAVRTADGKYAKIQVLTYYCGQAEPGCLTFRYEYQGNGSRMFEAGGRRQEPAGDRVRGGGKR